MIHYDAPNDEVTIRPAFWFFCFCGVPLLGAVIGGGLGAIVGALCYFIPAIHFSREQAILSGVGFAILGLCFGVVLGVRLARAVRAAGGDPAAPSTVA